MIKIKIKGDFSKLKAYLTKVRKKSRINKQATEIADECLLELKQATPKDTGLTAESWEYKISVENKKTSIVFINKNIQNGINIALLLEYGHGTANGGWVEGKKYIEPVLREKYLNVVNKKWEELTKL